MEERQFTVEEAAELLDCTPRTIRNLLAKGWLAAPVGRPGSEDFARISEKSLFQFALFKRVSHLPDKVLDHLRNGRKIFQRYFGKRANANRFYNQREDEAGPSEQAANPTGRGAPSTDPKKRSLHHDFVEQHYKHFRKRARQLQPDDRAIQDDIVQEMCLAVLEYDKQASPAFLFTLASNHAMDYLRYEACRGWKSLDEAREYSDKLAEQTAGLESYIDTLLQGGMPKVWIEEVLGYRLDAA